MAELDRMQARADIRHTIAKTEEARAMARKARVESIWYPVTVAGGIIGGTTAVVLLVLRLTGTI